MRDLLFHILTCTSSFTCRSHKPIACCSSNCGLIMIMARTSGPLEGGPCRSKRHAKSDAQRSTLCNNTQAQCCSDINGRSLNRPEPRVITGEPLKLDGAGSAKGDAATAAVRNTPAEAPHVALLPAAGRAPAVVGSRRRLCQLPAFRRSHRWRRQPRHNLSAALARSYSSSARADRQRRQLASCGRPCFGSCCCSDPRRPAAGAGAVGNNRGRHHWRQQR